MSHLVRRELGAAELREHIWHESRSPEELMDLLRRFAPGAVVSRVLDDGTRIDRHPTDVLMNGDDGTGLELVRAPHAPPRWFLIVWSD